MTPGGSCPKASVLPPQTSGGGYDMVTYTYDGVSHTDLLNRLF